ncbi:hypothetical protein F4802DRAFT_619709 [Xylaria palmicola]|nr:hypothetical protein F4802DRAFT_619709 [Xylaria palmicola]
MLGIPVSITSLLLAIVPLVFSHPAPNAPYDVFARDCPGICLTSFRWCPSESQNADGTVSLAPADLSPSDCAFPEHTYPYYDSDLNFQPGMATILDSVYYNITWKNAKEGVPVHLQWSFGDNRQVGTRTRDTHFLFRPSDMFSVFPTPSLVRGEALDFINVLTISQPDASCGSGAAACSSDESQPFAVFPLSAHVYLRASQNAFHFSRTTAPRPVDKSLGDDDDNDGTIWLVVVLAGVGIVVLSLALRWVLNTNKERGISGREERDAPGPRISLHEPGIPLEDLEPPDLDPLPQADLDPLPLYEAQILRGALNMPLNMPLNIPYEAPPPHSLAVHHCERAPIHSQDEPVDAAAAA